MQNYKIMVVDDEEISADVVTEIISESDVGQVELVTFYSSIKALDYLSQQPIDILITDINMPKLSGLELIKQIHAVQPDIRIIILTGYGSLEYATEAMRYGVRHFLQKPCSRKQLLVSVEEVIAELAHIKQYSLMERKHLTERVFWGEQIKNEIDGSISFFIYLEEFHSQIGSLLTKQFETSETDYLLGGFDRYTVFYYPEDREILWQLKQIMPLLAGQTIAFCVAQHVKISQAKEVLEKAIYYLSWPFYYPKEKIIDLQEKPAIGSPNLFELQKLLQEIRELSRKEDYLEGQEILIKLFTLAKKQLISPQILKKELIDLISPIFIARGKEYSEIIAFETKVQGAATYKQLSTYILEEVQKLAATALVILKTNSISENLNIIVEKYYSNPELSLKWIAQNILFLNAEHLGRVYLKETGNKFSNHLIDYRMEKAKKLLRTGRRVYEVAELVGYQANPDYFNKLFKKQVGITPSKYAKQGFSAG